MAVLSITRRTLPALKLTKSGRAISYTLTALCSSSADDPTTISAHVDCPKIDDAYAADTDLKCDEVSIEYLGGVDESLNSRGVAWVIGVSYKLPDPDDLSELFENPKFKVGGKTIEIPLLEDTEGKPVWNSAKAFFDDPVMAPRTNPTFSIERNVLAFTVADVETYTDHVNASPWLGFGAKKVRCTKLEGSSARTKDNVPYWHVVGEFELRWDKKPWEPIRVLDQGLDELIAGNKRRRITRNGEPIDSPTLLDGNGQAAELTADPVFLPIKGYFTADFSAMGLV